MCCATDERLATEQMPKRNLLKVIRELEQAYSLPNYDPEGFWECSWQGEYGSAGTLDGCIRIVSNYILSDLESAFEEVSPKQIKQRLAVVKRQCLTTGKAGVDDWWAIRYGKQS